MQRKEREKEREKETPVATASSSGRALMPRLRWPLALATVVLIVMLLYLGSGRFAFWDWAPTESMWVPPNPACTCDCWDAQIKAGFDQRKYYRSLYVNTDRIAALLLLLCIFYIVSGFTLFNRLFALWGKDRLRWSVAMVLLLQVFPNLFNFNATFNYLNDRWYSLFPHQLFFNVTEWISTFVLLAYADSRLPIEAWGSAIIVAMTGTHAIQLVIDEGFAGVFALVHHVPLRVLSLALGDFAAAGFFAWQLYRQHAHETRPLATAALAVTAMLGYFNFFIPTPQ